MAACPWLGSLWPRLPWPSAQAPGGSCCAWQPEPAQEWDAWLETCLPGAQARAAIQSAGLAACPRGRPLVKPYSCWLCPAAAAAGLVDVPAVLPAAHHPGGWATGLLAGWPTPLSCPPSLARPVFASMAAGHGHSRRVHTAHGLPCTVTGHRGQLASRPGCACMRGSLVSQQPTPPACLQPCTAYMFFPSCFSFTFVFHLTVMLS